MSEESKHEESATSDEIFHDALSKSTEGQTIEDILCEKTCNLALNEDNNGNSEDECYKDPEIIVDNTEDIVYNEDTIVEIEKNLTEEQKLIAKEKAEELKIEGNELFKNEDYTKSIDKYTTALGICPTSFSNERAILYANRAAAEIKIGSKNPAIEDCTKAIELNPHYIRALLRRAKLYEETEKLDESLEDYKKIIEYEPRNTEAHQALGRLPTLINERNEKLKTEMLGKLKDLGNMVLKPFGLSTDNFQMQQDPNTGSYSVNFQQNAKK